MAKDPPSNPPVNGLMDYDIPEYQPSASGEVPEEISSESGDTAVYMRGEGFKTLKEVREAVRAQLPIDEPAFLEKLVQTEWITSEKSARAILGRVRRTADASYKAHRWAYGMDNLPVDAAIGTVLPFVGDKLLAVVSYAHYVWQGLRAGITFRDYLRGAGYQVVDVAAGTLIPPPLDAIADFFWRANIKSVTRVFPPALARARETAEVLGINPVEVEGITAPYAEKTAWWKEKTGVWKEKIKAALKKKKKPQKALLGPTLEVSD